MRIARGKLQEWRDLWCDHPDKFVRDSLTFAELWADAMETSMDNGARLEDIAEESAHQIASLCSHPITRHIYGVSVSILARVWLHGEALRVWHNRMHGVGDFRGVINASQWMTVSA